MGLVHYKNYVFYYLAQYYYSVTRVLHMGNYLDSEFNGHVQRWENPALELLSVCNEEGIWLHKTSLPKKKMHAQLSAWELLVGLPNSGNERFKMCWAY